MRTRETKPYKTSLQPILALLSFGLLLTACGAWKQNPFDGKKGDFRNGQAKPSKPELTKPLLSDTVRIYSPDFQSLEEGVETDFPITARILLEGYTVDVNIENLAEFPNASYDKSNGKFLWKPPQGFVESMGGNGAVAQKTLIVRAYGYKPNDQVLVGEVEIPLYITREFTAPELISVTKPATFLREGETMLVPVIVKDKNAAVGDRGTWPKLLMQSVAGAKSLAGLTVVYREESLGNNQYRITLLVDARAIELSDSINTFKVGLVATSRFGRVSLPREMELDIYTSFGTPVTTWNDTLRITATDAVAYKFLITDPKLEAWLNLERTFSLPTGASLTCQSTGRGMLSCVFAWTPAADQTGSYPISIYVKSRNNNPRDTLQPIKSISFNVQVDPKGS